MSVNERFRRNVRIFYAWLGSTALLGLAPLLALRLIAHETTLWRAAGVVIGVAGMLPWMYVLVVIIRNGDEFAQRMHLVAIAVTAAVGLLALITLDWLERAKFIDTPPLMLIWAGFMVVWLIAVLLTNRYYQGSR